MTHTSTEQPDALLIAAFLRKSNEEAMAWRIDAAEAIERLHARVQELEASQARVPLSEEPFAIYRTHKDGKGNLTHDDWQFKYADLLRIPPQGVDLYLRSDAVLLPPQPFF